MRDELIQTFTRRIGNQSAPMKSQFETLVQIVSCLGEKVPSILAESLHPGSRTCTRIYISGAKLPLIVDRTMSFTGGKLEQLDHAGEIFTSTARASPQVCRGRAVAVAHNRRRVTQKYSSSVNFVRRIYSFWNTHESQFCNA